MMNASKKTVKGFTIVEMIVVIAIITILLGVLAPSLMSTYHKSRVNAANADAKMVYNAVQTEVVRYMAKDRHATDATKSGLDGTVWISYDPNGVIKVCTEVSPSGPDNFVAAPANGVADAIAKKVNRLVSGASDVHWAVCINNYIVKASVSSNGASSNCIGFYSNNKAHAESYSSGTYGSSFVSILQKNSETYDITSPKSRFKTEETKPNG